jgi:hypothetical protein
MADTLSDDQLVDVLQRYLTILQGHARTRLEFFLRSWKAPSPVSEEYAGKCIPPVADPRGGGRLARRRADGRALRGSERQLEDAFRHAHEGLNR